MIIFMLHIMAFTCLFSATLLMNTFFHFSSIDVTLFILKRLPILIVACRRVWSRFGGVSVQQVALGWVCVCVCVCVCRHYVIVSSGN